MADWRTTFAQPELPFLVVQLSSFGMASEARLSAVANQTAC